MCTIPTRSTIKPAGPPTMLSLAVLLTVILGAARPALTRAADSPSPTQPAPAPVDEARLLRVRFADAAGQPIAAREILELHCRDLDDEPVVAKVERKAGLATITLPNVPVQLSALVPVPAFGTVTLYADGQGRGYRDADEIDFIVEAAATRLRRVQAAMKAVRGEGITLPTGLAERIAAVTDAAPYDSLATTLAAGEQLTLTRARHRISKLAGSRKGFLFGCNTFGHPARGPDYDRRFRELFNFGTAHLYLSRYAPTETQRDFARSDLEVVWLQSMGMTAKLCPPIYPARSVTPDWIKNRPWPQTQQICHDLMLEVTKRYAGKLPCCEIVNEAHDYSNALELTAEQLTELARVCSQAAREGDPAIERIINCCYLWGEYAARPRRDGRPRRSPTQYLRDCIDAGVAFEIVGLQMYYPEYDLFEIDRMLDRYARLGKPIHITEMGCSSAPGIDPNGQRKKASAGWHGPWTEEMQADWVEAVYTLYYSKPYIVAVSWWDLADAVSFWPYGGLLRGDLSPKPSYLRLQALLHAWGYRHVPSPSSSP